MTRITISHSLALAALGAALVAGPAAAAETTATFQVSATVTRNCTIAAEPIDFGAYDPIAANDATAVNRTGAIDVRCTRGTAYAVKLDAGSHVSGTGARQMANGAEMLAYALYSNPGHTVPWTETTFVTGTAAGRDGNKLTVYAVLPAGQDVPEGSYADTVTATVEF